MTSSILLDTTILNSDNAEDPIPSSRGRALLMNGEFHGTSSNFLSVHPHPI